MRRLIVLLAVVGLLAACSSSGHAAAPPVTTDTTATTATPATVPHCTVASQITLTRINLTIGGKARYALVHIPVHWNGDTAVPVVLSFHGLGASATNQRSTDGFVASSDKDNFIVVYPQAGGSLGALGAAWNLTGMGDVDFVKAILDNLERREC